VFADPEQSDVRFDLDLMGHLLKKNSEIWFEYVLPNPPNLKDKLKQTGLRFHIEKDEKRGTLSKLSLLNKEGFLPKIETRLKESASKRNLGSSSSRKHIKVTQYEEPSSKERIASSQYEETPQNLRKGRSLTKLVRL